MPLRFLVLRINGNFTPFGEHPYTIKGFYRGYINNWNTTPQMKIWSRRSGRFRQLYSRIPRRKSAAISRQIWQRRGWVYLVQITPLCRERTCLIRNSRPGGGFCSPPQPLFAPLTSLICKRSEWREWVPISLAAQSFATCKPSVILIRP